MKMRKIDHFLGEWIHSSLFLLKQDLIKYLDETKEEYLSPEQLYQNASELPTLWLERRQKITKLPEIIWFDIEEQTQIAGPRLYVKFNNKQSKFGYELIRELSLPNVTYISIVKLVNSKTLKEPIFIFVSLQIISVMLSTLLFLNKKKKIS